MKTIETDNKNAVEKRTIGDDVTNNGKGTIKSITANRTSHQWNAHVAVRSIINVFIASTKVIILIYVLK